MDSTMHRTVRPVQLAVIAAPTLSLYEALAAARRQRESAMTLLRRAFAVSPRSPRPVGS